MTIYHVHLYREMRLTFEGVEADTPQRAAAIAHEKPSGEADSIDDCDGEDLGALVDVAGDETFEQSVTIDFAAERLHEAAPNLLAWSRLVARAKESGETVPDALCIAAALLIATLDGDAGAEPAGDSCNDPGKRLGP